MRVQFLFCLCLSFSSSCTKYVRVDIPIEKPISVLNSIIECDSTIVVDLSLSRHILESENGYSSIRGAKLQLFVGDIFMEELEEQSVAQSSIYTSIYHAAAGDEIRIEALLANEILKGQTRVPIKPKIVPERAFKTEIDAFGNTAYKISFTINDSLATHDYYQLRICKVNNGIPDWQNPISFTIENIKTIEGGIFDDFATELQSGTHYFDDETFNGKNILIKVNSNYHAQLDKVAIELSAISKESYLYFKSIRLQSVRNDDLLYEKVSIFSNILNGLGIVGAANRSIVIQTVE